MSERQEQISKHLEIVDAHREREQAWLKNHKGKAEMVPGFTSEHAITITHMCIQSLERQFKEQDAKREKLERRIATVLKCMQHAGGCPSCVSVLLGESDEKLDELIDPREV